ncbi:hypothetical protein O5165_25105, partial [Escherichia coli]|nr:hypothetical protein [Escherichia coli]
NVIPQFFGFITFAIAGVAVDTPDKITAHVKPTRGKPPNSTLHSFHILKSEPAIPYTARQSDRPGE